MNDLPACCTPTEGALYPERLYCAYNRAGDPKTAGLNYQGLPCPTWAELPENVRAKWTATASAAVDLLAPHIYDSMANDLKNQSVAQKARNSLGGL